MNRYDYYRRISGPGGYWPLHAWTYLQENKAECMKELKNYWIARWYGKDLPKIRETLMKELICLPEVVVDIIVEHLPYPYGIKKI